MFINTNLKKTQRRVRTKRKPGTGVTQINVLPPGVNNQIQPQGRIPGTQPIQPPKQVQPKRTREAGETRFHDVHSGGNNSVPTTKKFPVGKTLQLNQDIEEGRPKRQRGAKKAQIQDMSPGLNASNQPQEKVPNIHQEPSQQTQPGGNIPTQPGQEKPFFKSSLLTNVRWTIRSLLVSLLPDPKQTDQHEVNHLLSSRFGLASDIHQKPLYQAIFIFMDCDFRWTLSRVWN